MYVFTIILSPAVSYSQEGLFHGTWAWVDSPSRHTIYQLEQGNNYNVSYLKCLLFQRMMWFHPRIIYQVRYLYTGAVLFLFLYFVMVWRLELSDDYNPGLYATLSKICSVSKNESFRSHDTRDPNPDRIDHSSSYCQGTTAPQWLINKLKIKNTNSIWQGQSVENC